MNFTPEENANEAQTHDDIINEEIEQEHKEAANRNIDDAEKDEIIDEVIEALNL